MRRLHASSLLLETESRLDDQPEVDEVGDGTRLEPAGGKAAGCELFIWAGPNMGLPGAVWNGFALEGTLSRRPGVRLPALYILCERAWDDVGEAIPDAHRGLLCAVENVAEVGVLKSPGEGGRYEYVLSAALRYDSRESRDRGSVAMTRGGGLLLASA